MLQELACVDNREPFDIWREPLGRQSPRDLIHAAVLAASAHNAQPWRFALGEGGIDVHADLGRRLGSLDPFQRELHQSLGCAIENIAQAALAQGLVARVESRPAPLPPEPDETLAARVRLEPAPARETELFWAIPRRRTNRGAYDMARAVPDAVRAAMADLACDPRLRLILVEGEARARLGDLVIDATRRIVDDPETAADNARWFRFLHFDADRRDGLTLGTSMPSRLFAAAARLFPPSDESANRRWIGDTRVQVKTAALLGAIVAEDVHERALALEAGRLWQRLHLLLTARGLAAQPMNQPIERADRERMLRLAPQTEEAVAEALGERRLRPALLFRAGYPTREACLAPRRRLEEAIEGAERPQPRPWFRRWLEQASGRP